MKTSEKPIQEQPYSEQEIIAFNNVSSARHVRFDVLLTQALTEPNPEPEQSSENK